LASSTQITDIWAEEMVVTFGFQVKAIFIENRQKY
jgi:hypothetical protein